jgi:hypothetical protein
LSPEEYRQQWGLGSGHPLTAPGYAEQRSAMAKTFGLGRKPANRTIVADAPEAAKLPIETSQKPAATSKPVRKTRGATKRAEVVEPAATPRKKPVRTTRSRRAVSQSGQATSPAAEP